MFKQFPYGQINGFIPIPIAQVLTNQRASSGSCQTLPFTYYPNIGSRDVQTLDRFLSFVRYQLKKREKYYIN
jgi:hypothetical protein